MKYFPYLLLAAGMAFFGSATPVSKLVGADFPVLGAAGARVLLAGLVLLPFALWKTDGLLKLTRKDWLLVGGIALIGNAGFSLFMLYGMQMVSGVAGSVIMSLTPAIIALGSVLFLKEHMTRNKILALVLGLAGVLIMQTSSGGGGQGSAVLLGSLLVFLAICCEACYTLLGKKASEDMTPLKLTTLSALLAGLFLSPWIVFGFSQTDFQTLDLQDWSALAWWGVGTMALGSMFWYSGLTRTPGHIAAAFMVVMPVSALVLSYILLGENFQWIHVPGFGLAFASVILMTREHMKMSG